MEPIKLLGYAGLELIANELLPLNYLKRTGGTLNGNLNISNKSPVLTIQNTANGDTSLVLDRNGYANWRFLSNNGSLYFQSDYTDKKVDYYNVMILSHNSGNATFKGTVTAPNFIGNLVGNASSATKSTQDGNGNVITSKYVTIDTIQNISGAKSFSGLTSITNTTASTSKSTGALKVSGGIGISGQISADKMMVGDKVTLQYNVANECIDFVFS